MSDQKVTSAPKNVGNASEALFSTVAHIIAEQLHCDKKSITPESRFQADLGADSLDVVEVVMRIEDEYKIKIPDALVEKVETVGEFAEKLKTLI